MDSEYILTAFQNFLKDYDEESKGSIWTEQSRRFKKFWDTYILSTEEHNLTDADIDEIIKILDRNAKGNTKGCNAVAKVMIPQGAWRRMFHYIKYNQELRQILNNILTSKDEKISEFIDQLYKLNTGKKNNLTGKSANAINAFLFVSDPKRYLSVVSLNHREKIINYFKFSGGPNFQSDTVGVKVYLSNKAIIEGFKRIGINSDPRTVSVFLYRVLKEAWNPSTAETDSSGEEDISEVAKPMEKAMDLATFYLEEELENFLIKNWEKTELGKEYDLIEEEDDMVSQQYKTDIGKIDILAKDKKTMQYVVIELKRDQSSDDTVGQIARYMGWIEEKKSPGKSVKGIIIAAQYDDRLRYALKKIKDVEVYLYKVDFKLSEFRNG